MIARGHPWMAMVVLASVLSGCASPAGSLEGAGAPDVPLDPLTEPKFDLGAFLAFKVSSFDGTAIHVDLQLPRGDGPFPVILELTPYSALGGQAWGAARERGISEVGSHALAARYVPRGYAVAVAHVRGTGESGGCLTVGGPEEGHDGYAVVQALAEQPWSNGRVAMRGTSYVGTTPIQTAVLSPPNLTTIIPIAAVTDWYRYYYENGEPRMNGSPPPGASYPDPLLWLALGVLPGVRTGAASPDDAACPLEMTRQYWLQDDLNAWWQARNHGAKASAIKAPVLYVQGWRDENVATSMIPAFWPAVTSEKRAWFMQVGHGVPAARTEYHEYEHRWLDYWMLDRNNGALDLPPVVVEDNQGKWRAESDWPPRDARPARLWLSPLEKLTPAPGEDASASFLDDGVGAEGTTYSRASSLQFHGEPLTAPWHLAGEAVVHLEATSDSTDTQFTVLLYDMDAGGRLRLVTRGYLDARHRESLTSGQDLTPGARDTFEWRLHPRDHVFEEGHSVVVFVKSSDPYVIPDTMRARNTVHFGAEGSWIELPLLDPGTRLRLDAAPLPDSWRAPGHR